MNDNSVDGRDEIWLASYPRSGNTFIRMLLADCFDLPVAARWENNPADLAINRLTGSSFATPRSAKITKTHHVPDDDQKYIYVVRDGKSALLSYFHYLRDFGGTKLSIEDVIVGNAPCGSWSDHVKSSTSELRADNFLLLRFEEVIRSPSIEVEKLAHFLEQSPRRQFERTFEEMHDADPKFFRLGRDRAEEFTAVQSKLFEHHHGAVMRELGYAL